MIGSRIYCIDSKDISSEHVIVPWSNGIKLADPHSFPQESIRSRTVRAMLKKSIHIYFMDLESKLTDINEETVINCGYISTSDALGRTARDVAKKDSAEQLIENDRNVIRFCKPQITDDVFDGFNDAFYNSLTMKFPWYGNHNQLIGVFGCSILLNKHSLAESLTQLAQLGIINQALPGISIDNAYLSKREKDCLYHYVRSKSTREISQILGLSKRTIEHYLENIKQKLHVSTRSELIDKVCNYF